MNAKTMKKGIAAAVLAVAVLGSARAQDSEGVRFGLKLSPNLGWLRPDSKGIESDGTRLGYSFGLLTEFPVGQNGNYRFATGLFLYNQGGGYTVDFTYSDAPANPEKTTTLENTVKLRYVELPLTMKLMTSEIGYIRYYGQIGFSAAFNIRAKADLTRPVYFDPPGEAFVESFETLEDEDIKDDINVFKAGLIIGGGLEYNFAGTTSVLAGITYNNSFTNILNDVEFNGKKAKVYSDYIELTLGVFF
ncbi:MAG: porin family protein [Flavobacteriales bacterium]